MPSASTPRALASSLLAWYDRARRNLPWRAPPGGRSDPYHILVSETMLQQTTVATVAPRFAAFLARFPSLHALAAADLDEVLHEWQGLGYYRRARGLHACAQAIVQSHGGRLPEDPAALARLPGIGPYTAAAIAAIAFMRPVVPVDGNVQRVLARVHGVEAPLPAAAGRLRALAAELAAPDRPGDLAQALMDLGALVCRPRAPRCPVCPWETGCHAAAEGAPERLPRRVPRGPRPTRTGVAFLLRRGDGAILFRRRPGHGLLAGLHELPSSPWAEEGMLDLGAALRHAPVTAEWRLHPERVRHVFTHFVLELALAEATTDVVPPAGDWCPPQQLHRLALPTLMTKLLRLAGHGARGRRGG
jgi:A/G-specific adenine glycosylase